MKHVLQRLGTVPHLVASAFFDAHGECIASHSADIVHEQALSALGSQLAVLVSRTARNLAASQTVIFRFDGGVVVVRRARDYFLAALCEPDVDLTSGGAGFHIAVASRLLGIHTSRVPPRESRTLPVASQEIDEVAPALKPARVPRV